MRAIFDIRLKKDRISDLEKQMQSLGFWDDMKTAQKFSGELSHLKDKVKKSENILSEIKGIEEFIIYAKEESPELDESLRDDTEKKLKVLEKIIAREETETFFSGPYDKNNAIITIYSGAGGADAQDWAGMLLRMYERYIGESEFKGTLLAQNFGEEKGIKEATIEVEGKYAYGYLKHENGVHRLVRISPFSSQKLRHTSFALVEVLPQIESGSEDDIEIRPEDILVQTFRSSGPGGQYVNKTESAVRVKHLPSGVVVECQSERLQGENKEKALKTLKSKVFARKIKEEKEKIAEIRGGFIPAEWGNQIRSYVLHPYKMVKDHRTGVETSNTEAVLNGELDEFIEAGIKIVS